MKTSDLLLLGAVGLAAYWFLSKTHAVGTLVYVPRGISFNGGAMQIQVGVQNPSSTPLTLRSVFGTAFLNGNAIGNISDQFTQTIIPNSETIVTFSITPNIFGLAQLASGIIQKGIDSVNVSVSGYANVDGNTFPLTFNFSGNPT